jgi:hypothetical protein
MVLLAGDVKGGIDALVRREEIYAIPQDEVASYWTL